AVAFLARFGAGNEGGESLFAHRRVRRMQEVTLAVRAQDHQADVGDHGLAVGEQRDHVDVVTFAQLANQRHNACLGHVGLAAGFDRDVG
nr:hypothetical protein [Tanacetum cinerariifolium]